MAKFKNDVNIYDDYYSSEKERDAREDLFDEYGEEEEWKSPDDIPDERVSDYLDNDNAIAAEELKNDMDKFFKEADYFVIRGSVGRWNGTRTGFSIISDFDDVLDYLKDCDNARFYENTDGDLCIEGSHHDGDNSYVVLPINDDGERKLEDMDMDIDDIDDSDKRVQEWLNDPTNFKHGLFHKYYGFNESHSHRGRMIRENRRPRGRMMKESAEDKEYVVLIDGEEVGETFKTIEDAKKAAEHLWGRGEEGSIEIYDTNGEFVDEFIKESRRPRGRMLKENFGRSIIFKPYNDINGIYVGYADDKIAFEAVDMLKNAMDFIEKNGGDIEGSFTIY